MYCLPLLVFNHGFEFQNSICNGCHNLTILCLNLSDIAKIFLKDADYYISKYDTIHLLESSVLGNRIYIQILVKEINVKNSVCNHYLDYLIKAKEKNIGYDIWKSVKVSSF